MTKNFCKRIEFVALPIAVAIALIIIPSLAQAQLINLHNFTGYNDASEAIGLTMDNGGNLYGVYGGTGDGQVFELTRTHSGWLYSVLYSFAGGYDGAVPFGRVILGPGGALYGVTQQGGGSDCYPISNGCGTVYRLNPPVQVCTNVVCPWIETVLYRFTGFSNGVNPGGNLVFDQAGNLYGTTELGGNLNCAEGYGCGTVYKLTPSQGSWTESVLYSFSGQPDGRLPYSGLIFDNAGNLYGITELGGNDFLTYGAGTVFELSPSGNSWTEKILYRFQGDADGYYPIGGLLFDATGNLFGTTSNANDLENLGTVFMLTPSGDNWVHTVIYLFGGGSGAGPWDSVARDGAGNLYGTSLTGGIYGNGNLFRLTPSNGSWTYTDLHDFSIYVDGGEPSGVILDAGGNLYGTTAGGGLYGGGIAFEFRQ